MAVITKNDILAISEPFEAMYGEMANEIMIMLSEYLGKDIDEPIEIWQQKKMQEVSLIIKRVQAIQNGAYYAGTTDTALNEVVKETLKDIEPKLEAAAASGYLKKASELNDSLSIAQLKKLKKQEFLQTFRNMNAEMQNGATQSFLKAITYVVSQEQKRYDILDEAVRKEFEGRARQKVVADSIRKLINENVPAFVDRAGRKWSAEAYANMYTRTNVHNMSLDVVDKRNEDYSNDLIEVSKHAGARPLCAPYQGKVYSTGNRSGTTKDARGNTVRFKPLSSTSYGEPAGLFGINCGHQKYPFIPGFSFNDIKPLSKKEIAENDRIYAESQKQRQLEREVRKSKTKEQALRKAGLIDEADAEKAHIRERQKAVADFCKKTGRTRRYDREKVVGK